MIAEQVSETVIDVAKRLCPNPRVIVDGGAGKGYFAQLARESYPDAKIISFEPSSECFAALKENTAAIGVECYELALGSAHGSGKLNLTANDESNSLLGFLPDSPLEELHRPRSSEPVEIIALDDWLSDMHLSNQVDILKLDVQGAELMVLSGAKELLKTVRIVVSEVWHVACYESSPLESDVDRFMQANGFEKVAVCTTPYGIWSDAIYRRTGRVTQAIKLNIGAGSTIIEGFTPIDRKLGTEAYPLNYPDNSVEEIRCAHMLEHLSFDEVQQAFKEWNRVLRPGGRLRISVPDVKKVFANMGTDETWRFKLMGGQTDSDDFHKSAFDDGLLMAHFDKFGFENIQPWHSQNTDTAADPCSLNLEGFKRAAPADQLIKIRAIMSVPRVGWNDAWMSINKALNPLKIPVETFNGVFWGQCMQRAFEKCLADGVDWILCIDYDSMITADQVDRLLGILGENPSIDAVAALQCRRGNDETPLMSVAGKTGMDVDWSPIKVATAHFGLTLIRTECLKGVAKPWFKSEPDAKGEWSNDKLDDDIWFWHQWRLAGKNIYVAPDVRIGHLQLMVSEFDEHLQPRHVHVTDWRKDWWQ